jgi:hypothetical protein
MIVMVVRDGNDKKKVMRERGEGPLSIQSGTQGDPYPLLI